MLRVLLSAVCLAALGLGVMTEELFAADQPAAVPKASATGILITRLLPDGEAARKNLAVGDIITDYRSRRVTTVKALTAAIDAADEIGDDVLLSVDREGTRKTVLVKAGKLGVYLTEIVKGKELPVVPPETERGLNLERLLVEPQDLWYQFKLGGKHVGFQHEQLSIKNNQLLYEGEVGFDGGDEWGLNHFLVTATLDLGAAIPVLRELVFRNRVDDTQFRYYRDGERTDKVLWSFRANGELQKGNIAIDLIANRVIPSYVENRLCQFLPRREGACLHLTQLIDGQPRVGGVVGLWVGPEEEVTIAGKAIKTHRVEHRFFGYTGNKHWLDERGIIVRSDYSGAISELSTKEAALKDLHQDLLRVARQ